MRVVRQKVTLLVTIVSTCFLVYGVIYSSLLTHFQLESVISQTKDIHETNKYDTATDDGDIKVTNVLKAVPPFYPINGTGTTVDITEMFNNSVMDMFCTNHPHMKAIVPIYSACDNFERRTAIRQTLGYSCMTSRCKMFFIVGVSLKETVNRQVKDEMETRKDILIVDKLDTYRDLNNKAVAMLDWLIAHCQKPKYVIHAIDDAYPDIEYFIHELNVITFDNFIYGSYLSGLKPHRVRGSKIYLNPEEYPFQVLPDYIAGPAYAFLNANTKTLREHVHKAVYCWVEDYWLTGHVAQVAGTRLIASRKHQLSGAHLGNRNSTLKMFFNVHPVSVSGYYEIFNRTLNNVLSVVH